MHFLPEYELFDTFFHDARPWSALTELQLYQIQLCNLTEYIYGYLHGRLPLEITVDDLVNYRNRIDAEVENRRRGQD